MANATVNAPRVLGRYVLHDEIASGGMAVVHLARMMGSVGFSRTVAIKRLHAHLAREPEFVTMFLDEARLAARIQHPNVVPTLDVVALEGELFIVMEFVQGESLSGLLRALPSERRRVPVRIASSIMSGALYGLHAAHTACGERGEPLDIVHRDVSPQNVLVGVDGVPRLLDFGVAKAIGRLQTTRDGQIKGKTSYMAPEQLRGRAVDARTDVYAAAVVAWEALTGQRLFTGASAEETMMSILERKVPKPSSIVGDVPPALDDVVLRGLARDASARFATARDMAIAIEQAVPPTTAREVGEWVNALVGDNIKRRAARVREIESDASTRDTSALPATTTEPAVTSVTTVERPRSTRTRWIIGGAVVAALSAGGLAVSAATREAAVAPTAPRPPASTAAPVVEGSAARTPPVSVSVPAFVAATTSTPPAVKPPPPLAHPTTKSKPKCDPPYTVDAKGFREPKPECL